ncbi:MAG: S1C family serine protease [Rubripirellula sp.]
MRITLISKPTMEDLSRRLRSVCLIASAVIAGVPAFGAVLTGSLLVTSAVQAQDQFGSITVQSGTGTEIPVASELTGILSRGGVPKSIDQLWELESQQQKVAEAAVQCTVSVKIGPAQGCGVIITDSGYVLTAAHVAMRPGKKATITLKNGREVSATTLGMNRNVDAGLIRIDEGQNDGKPWPHATLGTSKNLVEGMWCVATGHPGGFDQRRGPVTRIGRISRVEDFALNTDCALIGGDSGGPLFDIAGKLIAIHSRIGNDVADNLHVPIDNYNDDWDRLRSGESWGALPGFRPVLGVQGSKSAPQAIVDIVKADSPAEAGGMQPGDIIDQFGEKPITDFESLKRAVADTMPGERVNIWVTRGGTVMRLTVEIGRAD